MSIAILCGPLVLHLVYYEAYVITHLFKGWENALEWTSVIFMGDCSEFSWCFKIFSAHENCENTKRIIKIISE